MKITTLTLVAALCLGIGTGYSQISKTITYQGVLKDASGARVTGTVALGLNIYAVSGGGSLYADNHASVDVANGLFTVVIGTGSGGAIGLPFNEPYELGVTVDGGTELSPRTLLTAGAYALNAAAVNISGGSTGDVLTNDGAGNGVWGAPGAGPQGPQGKAGDDGSAGSQGAQGKQGEQGDTGPVGSEFWDGDLAADISNTNSGNVGIGSASGLTEKFTVHGNILLRDDSGSKHTLISVQASNTNISSERSTTSKLRLETPAGGGLTVWGQGGGQGSYVGIGTDDPTVDLHVRKSNDGGRVKIALENSSSGANSHAEFRLFTGGGDAGDPYISFGNNQLNWALGIDNSDNDSFKISGSSVVGSSDFVTVDSSGNVGLGTTSPSRILHVVGASRFTNKIELHPQAPAVAGDLMLQAKGLVEAYSLKMLSAGSAEIYASGSGNVYFGDSAGGSADNFHFNKGQGIFNSLGQLGIGTDAPVRKLHVREGGDTGASVSGDAIVVLEEDNDSVLQFSSPTDKFFDIRWADSGGNGQGRIRYNHNDDHMSFSTNESERVRIDSSGNVGIGTTAPSTKLEVAGGDLTLSDSTPNLLINDTAESANGRLWKIASDGGYLRIQATRDDQGSNGTFLEMFRSGAAADRTAIATRLQVGATGAFSETLEVVGNSYSTGTVQSGPYLKIDGTSPVGVISTPTSGGYALMIQSNGGRGDFDTGAPLRLNPAGDPVGIGTGTGAVTEMLVVNGNILANGGTTRSVTANANTITMSMVADDALHGPYITWGVGAAMKVKHTDGAGTITNVATFQSNGILSVGGLVETSDRNEKQNIQTVDNALDKVMNMRGVNFEWKQNASETRSTDTQLGFVAQELEEVLPEVVMTNEDGQKSVAYSHVTAVLVEAVKELQATIETLKAEVESLKN